jgi:hypothetical protein
MTDRIRIKMLETVRPVWIYAAPGFELIAGLEYDATSNQYGAISGICSNGKQLGVKPGEFVFLEAPDWVKRIWYEYFEKVVA